MAHLRRENRVKLVFILIFVAAVALYCAHRVVSYMNAASHVVEHGAEDAR